MSVTITCHINHLSPGNQKFPPRPLPLAQRLFQENTGSTPLPVTPEYPPPGGPVNPPNLFPTGGFPKEFLWRQNYVTPRARWNTGSNPDVYTKSPLSPADRNGGPAFK